MDKKVIEYLQSLGMGEILITRVIEILDYYNYLLKEEFESIFVSEYIDSTGQRIYDNLWLFYKYLICEAKSFKSKDDYDVAPIRNVVYIRTVKTDFDGKVANENSTMTVNFSFADRLQGQLRASKQNCIQLMDVLTTKILKGIAMYDGN